MVMHNKTGVILVLCVLMVSLAGARAQNRPFEEYTVKAAFLYNFIKFTEWPETAFHSSSSPVTICVLGNDPFGESIEGVKKKIVGGRRLTVRQLFRVHAGDGCHVLFISSSERERVTEVLQLTRGRDVLTVADMKDFARAGGIINLIRKDETVRFEVNLDAAKRTKLKISSQLLKLADIVRENP